MGSGSRVGLIYDEARKGAEDLEIEWSEFLWEKVQVCEQAWIRVQRRQQERAAAEAEIKRHSR